MFQTAPGVTVPFPEKISEQFEFCEDGCIDMNISFEKLGSFLWDFYHMLPEPLFFVLEIPMSRDEEEALGEEGYHRKVFYLDGQSTKDIETIMDEYGELLLADGMVRFAVASHASREEIYIQKYKITTIYAPQARRFLPLLHRYGLEETEDLFTVWKTFSKEHYGECRTLTIKGLQIYDIAERLIGKGLYHAKTDPDF